MKWIVVTQPHAFKGEAEYSARLLGLGVDYIHLRKPEASEAEYESLIQSIPQTLHPSLTLHDHFALSEKYHVGGLHLNSRQHTLPETFAGRVSRSCHSMDEVIEWKDRVDYLFLSPIFDSVSKERYTSAFSHNALLEASLRGHIDHRVVALGGVKLENIPYLRRLGFGGVAQLGDVWQRVDDEMYLSKIADAVH